MSSSSASESEERRVSSLEQYKKLLTAEQAESARHREKKLDYKKQRDDLRVANEVLKAAVAAQPTQAALAAVAQERDRAVRNYATLKSKGGSASPGRAEVAAKVKLLEGKLTKARAERDTAEKARKAAVSAERKMQARVTVAEDEALLFHHDHHVAGDGEVLTYNRCERYTSGVLEGWLCLAKRRKKEHPTTGKRYDKCFIEPSRMWKVRSIREARDMANFMARGHTLQQCFSQAEFVVTQSGNGFLFTEPPHVELAREGTAAKRAATKGKKAKNAKKGGGKGKKRKAAEEEEEPESPEVDGDDDEESDVGYQQNASEDDDDGESGEDVDDE